jgi:manganese oxidase
MQGRPKSAAVALAATLLLILAVDSTASSAQATPLPASAGGHAALTAALAKNTPPRAVANDNRSRAGTMRGDTLFLELEIGEARWYPEAVDGPYVDAPVLAERGGRPQVPAPLIRVAAGSHVHLGVTNRLADSTVRVFGLQERRDTIFDTLVVAPGRRATVRFVARDPGTYVYWAEAATLDHDEREREQTGGAFIVDEPGEIPPDRVLVINGWGEPVDPTSYRNALTMNGRSWPHTEVLEYAEGDSVRWRVVNASRRSHPMHLHGFYFEIRSRGAWMRDSLVVPANRQLAVTENLYRRETMFIAWKADRAGNWLFHCHLVFHALPGAGLSGFGADHRHGAVEHMGGLVSGIRIAPRMPVTLASSEGARRMHLWVNEGARRGRSPRAFSYVLQRDGTPPAADSLERVGSPLILTRGEPTEVVVHNRLPEPTAVHWHGLELESPWDGVVGWSGHGSDVAHAIAPGDSFVARLSLPRAGTYIYHTHLSDVEQLGGGLYGPLIVTEPGERFDPSSDHPLVISWDGSDQPPLVLVNGDSVAVPLELAAGRAHRLRLICISLVQCGRWRIVQDSTTTNWRPLARDGADLPADVARETPADIRLWAGQTLDAEVRLPTGSYTLVGGRLDRPDRVIPIIVR